jgi:hypothetical protein
LRSLGISIPSAEPVTPIKERKFYVMTKQISERSPRS